MYQKFIIRCTGTWYHYASDELGSITHVEEGGKFLNRYEYDAWGILIVCEEQAENRFKFTGQQLDPISQQYYLRARYYNPVIGRFTQEDTYYEDGLNLYGYCRNNPVYYVDPSGNICDPAAERICKLIDEGKIKGQNRTKLEQYLKENAGKLTEAEKDIAKKLGVKGDGGSHSSYDPSTNKYPPRIPYAQSECQNVVDVANSLKYTNHPVVCVFTHEDGTISVGFSGQSGTKGSKKYAVDLQKALDTANLFFRYVSH